LLDADTPSGRQASWETLQLLIDALYPAGVRVRLEVIPTDDPRLLNRLSKPPPGREKITAAPRRKIDIIEFARAGGLASAAVRKERIPPEKRRAIARHAARVRWKKHAEMQKVLRKAPPPLPVLTTRAPFIIESADWRRRSNGRAPAR
jgi:hypothetical protein